MRRPFLLVGIILTVTLLFIGGVLLQLRSNAPEEFLRCLERGEGNQEDLLLQLSLVRGDTLPAMLEAWKRPNANPNFRALLIELFLKKYQRDADSRVEPLIAEALADPEAVVRARAVYCCGLYLPTRKQTDLASLASDPAPAVRRQVYMLLTEKRHRGEGLWNALDAPARRQVVQTCQAQLRTEADPDLKVLVASVIGREIERLRGESQQAEARSDVVKAESLLREALALNPGSKQAQTALARFTLRMGKRTKALAEAKRVGCLLQVPRLKTAPVVDGDPTDPAWKGALRKEDKFYSSTSAWIARHVKGRNAAYLGHCNGKLYIAFLGYEDDLSRLVTKHKNRDSDVWRDDCVEIFLDPGPTEKNVYQFVINSAGTLFDQYDRRKSVNVPCEVATKVFADRGYWSCEFAVAVHDLKDQTLTPESTWGFNIYRSRIGAGSECCAWWPPYGHNHRYDLFPLLVFKDVPAAAFWQKYDAGEFGKPVGEPQYRRHAAHCQRQRVPAQVGGRGKDYDSPFAEHHDRGRGRLVWRDRPPAAIRLP